MVTPRWARSAGIAGFTLGLLFAFFACSSKAEDGGSCDKAADCSSGKCSAGTCEGSDCTCEGSDCRSRSSCQDGWLCTRGDAVSNDAIPRCRKQCAGAGTCPSDAHCDNGICKAGPEPFTLTWLNIPRAVACTSRVPCEYKVRPSSGVNVETYTWTFGSAPSVDTHDPTTSFTFAAGGTYDVLVHARSTTGQTADLHTTEALCDGALGSSCDVLGTLCCEGTCTRGICK